MTTIHPENRQGNQAFALWVSPSDFAACPRCGIFRKIHVSRKGKLCRDCRTVEHHAARIEAEPAVGEWVCRKGVRVLVASIKQKGSVA